MPTRRERYEGLLLGTALGDSAGLKWEGLSKRRAARMRGSRALAPDLLVFGGVVSDDTEHACLTAQALLASRGGPGEFSRSLGWRLRGWFAALPPGVGLATARACIKLLIGFPPRASGVNSAGNGPAMRAPVIGAFARDEAELLALVHASTVATHTDPRAETGARVIALAARVAFAGTAHGATLLPSLADHAAAQPQGEALSKSLRAAADALARGDSAEAFAAAIGLGDGVSGFMDHTVPAALYCWLRHKDDPKAAIDAAIRLGGDTDSVAAITGALAGADSGVSKLPPEWISQLIEFPRSVAWMRRLADHLDRGAAPVPVAWPFIPIRNLLVLAIVLLHGFRRLSPSRGVKLVN